MPNRAFLAWPTDEQKILREKELQIAVVRFGRRIVRGQHLYQRAIIQLLHRSVTQRDITRVLAVASAFPPLRGACAGIRGREDETIDIVRQPCEIEAAHAAVRCQYHARSGLAGLTAKGITNVRQDKVDEVTCRDLAHVTRAKKDFCRGHLVGEDGELQVHFRVSTAVRFSTALDLVDLPRKFSILAIRPKAHRKAHLLEIVRTGDPLGFGFGAAQGRQEHSGQNCNDRNDDEQLNQREAMRGPE